MREETEGQFGGIGIVISIKGNVLTVIAPMEDTPGMKAGITRAEKAGRAVEYRTILPKDHTLAES